MSTATKESAPEGIAVSEAIRDIDSLIRQHQQSAQRVVVWMAVACVAILSGSAALRWFEVNSSIRASAKFEVAVDAVRNAVNAASAPQAARDRIVTMVEETWRNIYTVAQNSTSAGPQNFNTLFLSSVGLTLLIFLVSMSVYKHHLTEVSKLQNSKLAFTRVHVAMRNSGGTGAASILIQNALLDRAFEYRSGKEKVVEGPLPGHPASDIAAIVTERVLEAIAPAKPGKS